jgi:hypothetical protein
MSLIKQYMSILNEEKSFTSSGVAVDNTGELEGAEKAKVSSLPKKSGPEAVEVEKPVKGPHSEQDSDALPKTVSAESKNPFDLLYNKILAEEAFGDDSGDTFNFEGEVGGDESLDFGDELGDDVDSEEGTEEHEEDEEEGLKAVLDHLKSAVESLEKLVGSAEEDTEEVSDEDGLDFDLEDEVEDVETAEESVDAEYEGHSLVDQEKLQKGLNKTSNQQVRGAVPVTKKKAEVAKGKKTDGKPEELHVDGESLTSKGKHNVGGVTVGKGLFDQ